LLLQLRVQRSIVAARGPRLTVLDLGVYVLVIAVGALAVRLWRSRSREADLRSHIAELQRQQAEAAARARPGLFVPVTVEDQ
jgi:hypothetical protein